MTPTKPPFTLVLCVLAATVAAGAATDTYFDETRTTTLFAFDNVAIPLTQNLRVKMRQPEKFTANPVVPRGPKGSVDAWAVQFYGSIIREGDTYRLWYCAASDLAPSGSDVPRWRPAYAESKDGIHWTKPNLGLVEHNGSKANNLVPIDPPELSFLNLKVLHDPDDPDPERRYKMTTHVFFTKERRLGTLVPFFSPDGIHWKVARAVTPVGTEVSKEDLFLPWTHFEPSGGLYKWDGIYYASGQNANVASRPYHGRIARTFASGDFIHWTQASAVGFTRDIQNTLLGPGRSRDGEQSHEGISVWNRGNVLLGVYGRWHGNMEWKGVTIDLGFVMSNDGVHFREPAHEWTMIERGKDGAWDEGGLLQGQGFENIGDKTCLYYGSWDPRPHQNESGGLPPRGGVGLATLPRDRFGDLVVEPSAFGKGSYQIPAAEAVCEFITSSIDVPAGSARRFYLNAEGLGAGAALRIELLDHALKPLPGYSGRDAAVVRQNGFQTPVSWAGRTSIEGLPARVRLHVIYEGAHREAIRFSALYVRSGSTI